VSTARYALCPYIKQIRSVFKGLKEHIHLHVSGDTMQGYTGVVQLGLDGTCAETRILLSVKWTSPCDSVGAPVQSIPGTWVVRVN
jgi:hypothetical protein